mmetsp:Transcript_68384/g.135493  ORF Transcript_68384/g.135493 Transcript_68384/m.135493 type:complete len:241 (-) Transcript_68384:167-889(-)
MTTAGPAQFPAPFMPDIHLTSGVPPRSASCSEPLSDTLFEVCKFLAKANGHIIRSLGLLLLGGLLGLGGRRRGRLSLGRLHWLRGSRRRLLLSRLATLGLGRDDLALTRGLVLGATRLCLVRERLLEGLLLLRLVNVFHQDTLVLELVTLCLEVEHMVQVLVDLLLLAVLLQQPAQHTHAANPQNLNRHPRLLGSLPLAVARVPTLALRLRPSVGARTRVHFLRLLDDKAILFQLADVLP